MMPAIKCFRIQPGQSVNFSDYRTGPWRTARAACGSVCGSGELLTASLGWKSDAFFCYSFHCMLIKQMLHPGWIPVFNCFFNSVAKQWCKWCKKQLLSSSVAVNGEHPTPRLAAALLVFSNQSEALVWSDAQRWFKLTLFTLPGRALESIASFQRRLCWQKPASSFPNWLESIEDACLSCLIFSSTEAGLLVTQLPDDMSTVGTAYRGTRLWNKLSQEN